MAARSSGEQAVIVRRDVPAECATRVGRRDRGEFADRGTFAMVEHWRSPQGGIIIAQAGSPG